MKKRSPIVVYALTFFTGSIYFFYWMFRTMRDIEIVSMREIFNIKMKVRNLIVVLVVYIIAMILIPFGLNNGNSAFTAIMFILAFSLTISWFVLIVRYLREISEIIASIEMNNSMENQITKRKTTLLFFLYFTVIPYVQIHMNRILDNLSNSEDGISYQEDITKHKKTVVKVIIGLCLGVIIFISVTAFGVMHVIKNSNSYQTAINYIQQTSEISTEVGEIVGYGLFPSASVEISNGYGTAQYRIKVLGKEEDLAVNLLLEKTPDSEWVVKEIAY